MEREEVEEEEEAKERKNKYKKKSGGDIQKKKKIQGDSTAITFIKIDSCFTPHKNSVF